LSVLEPGAGVPDIWLRSFFGFDPTRDGYIGWTKEAGRDNMIRQARPGDLVLIYGADTPETATEQRRQALGFLQIDLDPIMDVDKSSAEGLRRKRDNGWEDKWTYALPVRRAWRIDRKIELRHLAPATYTPEMGRAIAAWSKKLTPEEVETVLQLPVTEVDVYGEPPIGEDAVREAPFRDVFRPSRGVQPSFGTRASEYLDGPHKLYLARFEGDIGALLGRPASAVARKTLVKAGFTNDPKRRCAELNSGIPPAANKRWILWQISAAYPSGAAAKEAEDALKADFAARFESLGGEFFLGDETSLMSRFVAVPAVAKIFIRA